MFFGEKKESSADFLIKMVIFLGAVSAIFVAVALLVKKYHKKLKIDALDDLDFEDDDFCYDCCDFDNCDDVMEFKASDDADEEVPAEEKSEEASASESASEEE